MSNFDVLRELCREKVVSNDRSYYCVLKNVYSTWCDVLIVRYFASLFVLVKSAGSLKSLEAMLTSATSCQGTERRCIKECVANGYHVSAKFMMNVRVDSVRAYVY